MASFSLTLAAKDTYLLNTTPTTAYGSSTIMTCGVSGSAIARILIAFDASSLIGETISSATLFINATAVTAGGAAALLTRVGTAWVEGTATWNTPWIVNPGDPTSPFVTTNLPTVVGLYQIPNIAHMVQDAIDNRAGLLDMVLFRQVETGNGFFTGLTRESGFGPIITGNTVDPPPPYDPDRPVDYRPCPRYRPRRTGRPDVKGRPFIRT